MDDEEIIVKCQALMTLFNITYELDRPIFDGAKLNKLLCKHLAEMLSRVVEDDESYLKLTKLIGKIGFCLHKFYPETFKSVESVIAKFFSNALYKRDDVTV